MRQIADPLLVYYLYHSGFAVVTERHILVFDYYRDCPSQCSTTIEQILDRALGKQVVVFVSHAHHDHYNPVIWDWRAKYADIHYVVSADVGVSIGSNDVTVMQAHKKASVGALDIATYASTDAGVAFWVEADGYSIFHAGDLNWWHWEGEPDEDNAAMAKQYAREIDAMPSAVDIAFIPVDPRLLQAYALGLIYFMSRVEARLIFPMHFADDYAVFTWLKRDLSAEALSRIAQITPSPLPFYLDSRSGR
jgi:L-ascorbate metabolism protein UlaG (beta-lactamase superfamily)